MMTAHTVVGFIDCPDCAGRGTVADELTPGVVRREMCGTCYGDGVLPLCGDVMITLPDELITLTETTDEAQS